MPKKVSAPSKLVQDNDAQKKKLEQTEIVNDEEELSEIDENDEHEADVDDEEEPLDEDLDKGDVESTSKDDCVYAPSGKRRGGINKISTSIDKEDDDGDEIDATQTDTNLYVPPDARITCPRLTKYERIRLLATRTVQLTMGAKPMIKNVEGISAREIAQLELEHRMIPLYIVRPLPNGKKELWALNELAVLTRKN